MVCYERIQQVYMLCFQVPCSLLVATYTQITDFETLVYLVSSIERSKENLCHNVITYIFISHIPTFLKNLSFNIKIITTSSKFASKSKETPSVYFIRRNKRIVQKQKSTTIIL